MKLRPFQLSDTAAVVTVYRNAIRTIGPAKYNPEEVEAWARHPEDVHDFGMRLTRGYTLVAEADSQIHAFGQVEPFDCFSFLYTAGGAKAKCLGVSLYNALEDHAYFGGVIDLYAEVSRIGRPFAERRGFVVYEIVHQTLFGVDFEWYRMKKTREAALSPRFARRGSGSAIVEDRVMDCPRRAS